MAVGTVRIGRVWRLGGGGGEEMITLKAGGLE